MRESPNATFSSQPPRLFQLRVSLVFFLVHIFVLLSPTATLCLRRAAAGAVYGVARAGARLAGIEDDALRAAGSTSESTVPSLLVLIVLLGLWRGT